MDQDILRGLIQVVPVVVTPFIVWALSRFGIPSDEARMSKLSKRLDLISRLHQMQSEINDPALKNLLDAESEWCKHYLESQTHVEASFQDEVRKDEPQLLIARFFLTNPSGTKKHRVLRGFFYVFFIFFILELLGFIVVLFPSNTQNSEDFKTAFLCGALFYLLLALIFRMLAQRKLKLQQ